MPCDVTTDKPVRQLLRPYSPPNLSLVDRLQYWVDQCPHELAFVYLADGEGDVRLSYARLDLRARAIAAELQARGMTGQRALLLYPPGLDFVEAFFGCLYATIR